MYEDLLVLGNPIHRYRHNLYLFINPLLCLIFVEVNIHLYKKLLTNIKILNLYRLSIQYVYLPLIKKDLKEIMEQWNNHLIRRQKLGDTIQGIPDVLFKNPEIVGENLLRIVAKYILTNIECVEIMCQTLK